MGTDFFDGLVKTFSKTTEGTGKRQQEKWVPAQSGRSRHRR